MTLPVPEKKPRGDRFADLPFVFRPVSFAAQNHPDGLYAGARLEGYLTADRPGAPGMGIAGNPSPDQPFRLWVPCEAVVDAEGRLKRFRLDHDPDRRRVGMPVGLLRELYDKKRELDEVIRRIAGETDGREW